MYSLERSKPQWPTKNPPFWERQALHWKRPKELVLPARRLPSQAGAQQVVLQSYCMTVRQAKRRFPSSLLRPLVGQRRMMKAGCLRSWKILWKPKERLPALSLKPHCKRLTGESLWFHFPFCGLGYNMWYATLFWQLQPSYNFFQFKVDSLLLGFCRWSQGRASWPGAWLAPWPPPSSHSTPPPPPSPSSTPTGFTPPAQFCEIFPMNSQDSAGQGCPGPHFQWPQVKWRQFKKLFYDQPSSLRTIQNACMKSLSTV